MSTFCFAKTEVFLDVLQHIFFLHGLQCYRFCFTKIEQNPCIFRVTEAIANDVLNPGSTLLNLNGNTNAEVVDNSYQLSLGILLISLLIFCFSSSHFIGLSAYTLFFKYPPNQ